jgi:hypothetical protein
LGLGSSLATKHERGKGQADCTRASHCFVIPPLRPQAT